MLSMVDAVLLVVDATEGPMSQTKVRPHLPHPLCLDVQLLLDVGFPQVLPVSTFIRHNALSCLFGCEVFSFHVEGLPWEGEGLLE